ASQYQQLVDLPGAPAAAWTALARTLLAQNARLAPAARDWTGVERALEQAAQAPADALAVLLVRAGLLLVQGQAEQAQALLEQACRDHPTQLAVWSARVAVAEGRGQADAARAVWAEAERHLGDSVELRLARAASCARRGGREARRALAGLGQG